MHLLDVNVLIALGDPNHVHHHRVRKWFLSPARQAWATCPIVENGFVRILGQTTYPGFSGGPEDARKVLAAMKAGPGYQFWEDGLSLCDQNQLPHLTNSKHLTDLYLLALAISRQGKLATLDQRIDPSLVPGGIQAYCLLP